MLNSEGKVGEDEIWGKRANWVDYSGEVDGESLGIAIFDNPANIKHPTYWHARDYGLFAVNPFGEHDFYHDPKRDGSVTIALGESLTLRYRVVIHHGDAAEARLPQLTTFTRQNKRNCYRWQATNHSLLSVVTPRCLWNVLLKLAKMESSNRLSSLARCAS